MNSVSDKKKKKLIKAVNNRILLKKDRAITAKGNIQLIKTEGMDAPPYSGVIISVGPDVKDTDYAEGVRVTFSDMAGVEFDVNGYYLGREYGGSTDSSGAYTITVQGTGAVDHAHLQELLWGDIPLRAEKHVLDICCRNKRPV